MFSPEVRLVLAVFTLFRIAELIAIDDGPFDVFMRFRVRCARQGKGLSRLVSCPYCVGMYFAPLVALCVVLATPAGDAILLIGGIAGAQAALQGIAGRST